MALLIKKKTIPLFILFLILSFSLYLPASTNEDCLACHEDTELKAEDGRSLFVNSEKFVSSIHGLAGFSCVDCHADLDGFEDFPHAEDLQAVSCNMCHDKAAEEFEKSIHSQANPEKDCCYVSCKDCHGNHNIKPIDDLNSMVFPLNLPRTCERCHLERVKTERGTEFIKQYEKSIDLLRVAERCSGREDQQKDGNDRPELGSPSRGARRYDHMSRSMHRTTPIARL